MPFDLRCLLIVALQGLALTPVASAQESSSPEVPVDEVPENPYTSSLPPPAPPPTPLPPPQATPEAATAPPPSGPFRRPPAPPESRYVPEAPRPRQYLGLLLAGGPLAWRMSSSEPEASDLLGGLRIEGGYSMVGHALYGSISALYALGDLDGFAGYGNLGLGLRGFMGRIFFVTGSAQLTYGLFHRGDAVLSGAGFLVSGGFAIRYQRLQVVLEVLATGSKGFVMVGPSLMFGWQL